MTPEERLAEVAFLVAAAYLRVLISREKGLDSRHQAEALCGKKVDGEESVTGKEKP
jgi:hypothetical protein